jgi:rod shape-determining protein MreC
MKKFNLSKLITIALIIVIASFTAITISSQDYRRGNKPNAVIQVINDGTAHVNQIVALPFRFLSSKFLDFQNVLNTYQQNSQLKEQLTDTLALKQHDAAMKQENSELKAALGLKNSLTNYQIKNAVIITRSPSSWEDLLIINEGAKSGLKSGMLVMSDGGIIGRLSQVNESSSKVLLLTGSEGLEDEIPIRIGNSYGLLSGYDKQTETFIVTAMTDKVTAKAGEQVLTSGLDGHSPSGLLIGKVAGQAKGTNGNATKIDVTPASNFYDLHFVAVIKNQTGSN